jgi:hypothetical protein
MGRRRVCLRCLAGARTRRGELPRIGLEAIVTEQLLVHSTEAPEENPFLYRITVKVFPWSSRLSWKLRALQTSRWPRQADGNLVYRRSVQIGERAGTIAESSQGLVRPPGILISDSTPAIRPAFATAAVSCQA